MQSYCLREIRVWLTAVPLAVSGVSIPELERIADLPLALTLRW